MGGFAEAIENLEALVELPFLIRGYGFGQIRALEKPRVEVLMTADERLANLARKPPEGVLLRDDEGLSGGIQRLSQTRALGCCDPSVCLPQRQQGGQTSV